MKSRSFTKVIAKCASCHHFCHVRHTFSTRWVYRARRWSWSALSGPEEEAACSCILPIWASREEATQLSSICTPGKRVGWDLENHSQECTSNKSHSFHSNCFKTMPFWLGLTCMIKIVCCLWALGSSPTADDAFRCYRECVRLKHELDLLLLMGIQSGRTTALQHLHTTCSPLVMKIHFAGQV